MKRQLRLRRQHDFERLLTGSRLFAGSTVVVFAAPTADSRRRVGVAVSRRIRGAVARNRARRRLREAARLRLLPAPDGGAPGADIVVIARPAALKAPFGRLLEELERAAGKLAER